ncbi:DUF924-domain-containing protein [Aspergillus cavernicola]|uniref:DUF924-domain-containing protein n=1 Tax=Aspergillus cavernicola TaxID=176166 RepID=A0ABR4IUU4_9EURO
MSVKSYHDVLDIWFGPKCSPTYLEKKSFWYGTSTADDAYVHDQLGETYQAAKEAKLDAWVQTGQGEGALALILLLDQVPRNLFRGTPQAYATDSKAIAVARQAVESDWDKAMPTIQRRYIYSPLNHSESMEDQTLSLRLFTELGDSHHLRWAQDFYNQIKQDGRFIHRDEILGR